MIICLLWKLADCLSPVPEELPPPRDFSLKSATKVASVGARMHKGGKLRDGPEEKMQHGGAGREKWRQGEKMEMPSS